MTLYIRLFAPLPRQRACLLVWRVALLVVLLVALFVLGRRVSGLRVYERVLLACPPRDLTSPLPVTHFVRNSDDGYAWYYVNPASSTNSWIHFARARTFATHADVNAHFGTPNAKPWIVDRLALDRAAAADYDALLITEGDRSGCCPKGAAKCELIALNASVRDAEGAPCRRRDVPVLTSNTFTFPNVLLACE